MSDETKSNTKIIADRDDTSYLLDGVFMRQLENEDEEFDGDDLYFFNITECEYVDAISSNEYEEGSPETIKFYCYFVDSGENLKELITDKSNGDEFYLDVTLYYPGVAKLYIGCRCFTKEDADILYKWLSQRQDIKDMIDKKMTKLGCKGFLDTDDEQESENISVVQAPDTQQVTGENPPVSEPKA